MSFVRVLIIMICGMLLTAPSPFLQAQEEDKPRMIPAPDRKAGEGEGPFERLIIRGATVIDGSGAPPIGPVDIVIGHNDLLAAKIHKLCLQLLASGDLQACVSAVEEAMRAGFGGHSIRPAGSEDDTA